jgi:pyruvate/2-oxoglutarate dehydrogenase complex dihydrolipoamide dehydrogenase (E3) component
VPVHGLHAQQVQLLHDAVSGATWDEARTHRDEVVEHLDDGSHAEALEQAGVTVVRSGAKIVDEGTVEADGRRWRARYVVLATGSSPVVPPIAVARRRRFGQLETAAMLIASGQSPNWAYLGLEDVDVGDAPDVDDEYRVGGRDGSAPSGT